MYPSIELFGLEIPTFGLMMLTGMVAAIILVLYLRRYQPYNDDDLSSMAIITILTGFVGSKLMYWLVELDEIIKDPHFLLEALRSGFVFYGALIGGAIGIWVFAAHKKQCALAYADIVVPAFSLGQGFGRIGCFLAGCCYGCHTDSCLGVNYPSGTTAALGNPRLPTQLFESAFCIIFAIVLVLILRKQKRYGTTLGIYLIGYAVWRFIIEFYRDDDRGVVGSLSTSQFIAIFAVIAGIILLAIVIKKKTPVCEELKAAVKKEYAGETEMIQQDSAKEEPKSEEQTEHVMGTDGEESAETQSLNEKTDYASAGENMPEEKSSEEKSADETANPVPDENEHSREQEE